MKETVESFLAEGDVLQLEVPKVGIAIVAITAQFVAIDKMHLQWEGD